MRKVFLTSVLLVACIFLSCRKSDNSSSEWQIVPLNYNGQLRSIAFMDAKVGVIPGGGVFSDSAHSILLGTIDGGNTWQLDTCAIAEFVGTQLVYFGGAFYLSGSHASGENRIYRSTDLGKIWTYVHAFHVGSVYFFDDKRGLIADLATINRTETVDKLFHKPIRKIWGILDFPGYNLSINTPDFVQVARPLMAVAMGRWSAQVMVASIGKS